jgi:hypothetical protein
VTNKRREGRKKINKKIKSKNGGRRIDWHVGESNARSNETRIGEM